MRETGVRSSASEGIRQGGLKGEVEESMQQKQRLVSGSLPGWLAPNKSALRTEEGEVTVWFYT